MGLGLLLLGRLHVAGQEGSVQEIVSDRAKTPDFSFPKLAFTQKSDHSLPKAGAYTKI
jgi:hypothetical protein